VEPQATTTRGDAKPTFSTRRATMRSEHGPPKVRDRAYAGVCTLPARVALDGPSESDVYDAKRSDMLGAVKAESLLEGWKHAGHPSS
jgi:hypothetical protein